MRKDQNMCEIKFQSANVKLCTKREKAKQYSTQEETSYFENSELINKKDYDDKDPKQIFEEKVRNNVDTFIGRYSNGFDNIVLLLGAGASITSYNKGGVTVEELKKFVEKDLENNNELFDIHCLQNKMSMGENTLGLEDLISKMHKFRDFCHSKDKKKFNNTLNDIYRIIIKKTNYDFKSEYFNHGKLINYINNNLVKKDHKLNIVTTNYDTLIEDAADSLNYTIFDGFSFSRKPKFDDSMFDWNFSRRVTGFNTNELIYKSNVINLLKIHGSLTWKKDNNNIYRVSKKENVTNLSKSDETNMNNYNLPLMIFPSSDKYAQSYQEPFFSLFTKFQSLMRQENTLIISNGFSFADDHIFEMIETAIKNNPQLSLLITDYSLHKYKDSGEYKKSDAENEFDDKKNDNWHKMVKLMDTGYKVAFLKATLDEDLCDYFGEEVNANR
jgi:hypothetical protein